MACPIGKKFNTEKYLEMMGEKGYSKTEAWSMLPPEDAHNALLNDVKEGKADKEIMDAELTSGVYQNTEDIGKALFDGSTTDGKFDVEKYFETAAKMGYIDRLQAWNLLPKDQATQAVTEGIKEKKISKGTIDDILSSGDYGTQSATANTLIETYGIEQLIAMGYNKAGPVADAVHGSLS